MTLTLKIRIRDKGETQQSIVDSSSVGGANITPLESASVSGFQLRTGKDDRRCNRRL
jgi:hypothetical protein